MKRVLLACVLIVAGLGIGREIASLPRRQFGEEWLARRAAANYVGSHAIGKLQIGAGGNDLPGWFNTDIEPGNNEWYLDATRHFPFPDGTLRYVFSEHVIEHLTYEQGLFMLRESYRVLAPGGKVKVATPDLSKLIALFETPRSAEVERYVRDKLTFSKLPATAAPEVAILNFELRSYGHQFVYDPRMLRDSLERAGFTSITQVLPGESADPELRDLERRHKSVMAAMNDRETMVFEARKPGNE